MSTFVLNKKRIDMDYTKVQRPLIYADKSELDFFDVDTDGTLDALMFDRIQRSMICGLGGAARVVLDIFNNAYYITTLILMEKRPVPYFISYVNISMSAGGGDNTYKRYFSAMTMAMVYNYLRASDKRYGEGKGNILLERICNYHNEHYTEGQWDGDARFLFLNNVLAQSELESSIVERKRFRPRGILNILKNEKNVLLISGELDYLEERIAAIRVVPKCVECYDLLIERLRGSCIQGMERTIGELEGRKALLTKAYSAGGAVLEWDTRWSNDDDDDDWENIIDEELVGEHSEAYGQLSSTEKKVDAEALAENRNLREELADVREELLRLKSEQEDKKVDVELKLRIETLNLLLRKAGYDTNRIKKDRLNASMRKLYRLILGQGADSLLKECIGKVTYKKKPQGVDEKVKEINEILGKINSDWRIQL